MKKKKLLLLGLLVCVLVIAATAFYWYQKPRTLLTNVKADYTLTAKELYAAFQQDEKKANQQFLEKIIEVTGTVDNVQATDSTTSLVLAAGEMGGINCSVRKINYIDAVALPIAKTG